MTMAALFCFLKEKEILRHSCITFLKTNAYKQTNQSDRGIQMLDQFIVLNVLWHVKLYRVEKNLYNG